MAHEVNESRLRGSVLAAAAVLGVPVDFVDGEAWSVEGGRVQVGLGALAGEHDTDTAVAHTLLVLWESAREVKLQPLRRARRLSLARLRPELEPALATIDRLLAATEMLQAFPAFRLDITRVLSEQIPAEAEVLPRHLQWLCLLLVTAIDVRGGADLVTHLAPEVTDEYARLEGFGGSAGRVSVLRVALSADATRTGLQRFERAYSVVVPPYERLLERDLNERGITESGTTRGGSDDEASTDVGVGAAGGADEDAKPGGEAEDAASEGAGESARAGDRQESAEGADLFAAEQAGFVEAVLDTPLPAEGSWVDGLERPEIEALPAESSPRPTPSGLGSSSSSSATPLAEYRGRARGLSANIDELREVWRRVIAERVEVRNLVSRHPESEGEILDRDSLVRTVSEVIAGVDRPRAFLNRHPKLKRAQGHGSTDYVLLIDRSASMQGAPAEAAADAALVMLESLAAVERDIAEEERALGIDLGLSVRTALIVFDSAPAVVKPLSGALDDEIRRRMHAEIRSPRGSTNDTAALEAAANELGLGHNAHRPTDGHERRRVVIVVGDGGTDDEGSAKRVIRRLREAGVAVFGIGIRTHELVTRFAPEGMRLDDPALLATELGRLVSSAGLDAVRRSS